MPEPSESSAKRSGAREPGAGLVAVTIDAAAGRIVEIRSIDDAGAPGELSDEQRARLAEQSGGATVEHMLERAFEAGIACVLGDGGEDPAPPESEEDAALRRLILRPMIENSAARELMRRETLDRAIVGTLLQEAVAARSPAASDRPQQKH